VAVGKSMSRTEKISVLTLVPIASLLFTVRVNSPTARFAGLVLSVPAESPMTITYSNCPAPGASVGSKFVPSSVAVSSVAPGASVGIATADLVMQAMYASLLWRTRLAVVGAEVLALRRLLVIGG